MSEQERALLERLAQGPVGGDALAREAGQTRAAVWKRIDALRRAGVAIQASPGGGYRLQHALELLDEGAIRAALPPAANSQVASFDIAWTLESTNSALLARPVPARGCAVLLAERQTGGRGRRGRAWASPLAAHVYLSVARRFEGGLARLGGLSLVAGVAACEALRAMGFAQVALKWPNDLVVADAHGLRKLGGVLVEGGGETAGTARAVVGIGINVRMPEAAAAGIDQPWSDLAALADAPPSRNAVVGGVLARLLPALQAFDADGLPAFLSRYAPLDALAGREVEVREAHAAWTGVAGGVEVDGALCVSDAKGRARRVHAGDVSLRLA